MWLPLILLVLGTWPATQACALTGNRTGDPLVSRSTLNPLSHTSRGRVYVFNLYKKWTFHVDKMYLVPSSLITLCCYFRFLLFTLFCLLSLIFCLRSKRKKQVPLKTQEGGHPCLVWGARSVAAAFQGFVSQQALHILDV